jgi:type IV pilus assembly protein PilO
MNELVGKLLKLKAPLKAAVTVGVLAVIFGVYYMLFYTDIDQGITSAQSGQTQLKTEKESYEKRKREYVAYREELRKLQEEQRELLKALPKKAEIPSFISSVQEQAELSGLEVLTLTIDSEAPEELYVRIPVRMEVRGTYHSLTRFFKNVSELKRIVNIENFALQVEPGLANANDTGPPKLRARFVAATFRYVEKSS